MCINTNATVNTSNIITLKIHNFSAFFIPIIIGRVFLPTSLSSFISLKLLVNNIVPINNAVGTATKNDFAAICGFTDEPIIIE